MDRDFEFVCLPCAEGGKQLVMFTAGRYRKYQTCKCGTVCHIPSMSVYTVCQKCGDRFGDI